MNKQRVLIVEDDRSLAAATGKLLSHMDYEITIADSVKSAETALTGGTYFDLVMLDLDLGDGVQATYELLDRLATNRIALPPVIIFSGKPEEEVERAVGKIGSYALLRKPTSAQALVDAIERSLNSTAGND
jgi:DNA-binding NtrC family response regulator